MNSASKVAEIFESAGMSFSRLGLMTMDLQHLHTQQLQGKGERVKWGEEEVGALRDAVLQFGNDIDKICEHMKLRSVEQIRTALKRKAVQQAAESIVKGEANSAIPGVAFEQSLLQDDAQISRATKGGQDGNISAKKLKIGEVKNSGAVVTQDNLLLSQPGQINNSSIIGSALDKLKYEPKDFHEIDIEG